MIQQFYFWVSKENENTNLKWYMHPHVHCSIIYNNQDTEATYMSTDGWMDKEDMAYKQNIIQT